MPEARVHHNWAVNSIKKALVHLVDLALLEQRKSLYYTGGKWSGGFNTHCGDEHKDLSEHNLKYGRFHIKEAIEQIGVAGVMNLIDDMEETMYQPTVTEPEEE